LLDEEEVLVVLLVPVLEEVVLFVPVVEEEEEEEEVVLFPVELEVLVEPEATQVGLAAIAICHPGFDDVEYW
jgi:hypothetical protein